jgi:hypothetical protein
LLWLRRLIFLLLLAALVLGYLSYKSIITNRRIRQAQKHALVTAQVWVASARLRNEPQRFITYRDSLLTAYGLSKELIQAYLDRYKNQPEKYEDFANLVKWYVDSLSAVEIKPIRADSIDTIVE